MLIKNADTHCLIALQKGFIDPTLPSSVGKGLHSPASIFVTFIGKMSLVFYLQFLEFMLRLRVHS